jgi:hypothetical protein
MDQPRLGLLYGSECGVKRMPRLSPASQKMEKSTVSGFWTPSCDEEADKRCGTLSADVRDPSASAKPVFCYGVDLMYSVPTQMRNSSPAGPRASETISTPRECGQINGFVTWPRSESMRHWALSLKLRSVLKRMLSRMRVACLILNPVTNVRSCSL